MEAKTDEHSTTVVKKKDRHLDDLPFSVMTRMCEPTLFAFQSSTFGLSGTAVLRRVLYTRRWVIRARLSEKPFS